jgi:hypothetical protein
VTGSGFKRTVIRGVEANPAEHKQIRISLEPLASVPHCCVDPVKPLIEPEHVVQAFRKTARTAFMMAPLQAIAVRSVVFSCRDC